MLKVCKPILVLLLALLCARADSGLRDEKYLQSLFESHQWFQLSNAVNHQPASNFIRGAVAAALDKKAEAEKFLRRVIAAEPNTEEAYKAHELLVGLYSRHGLYRESLEQLEAMRAQKPDSPDILNVLQLFKTLVQNPNQSVVHSRRTRLRMYNESGNLAVPLSINGHPARYILDTGFNISGMSESETVRLGLEVTNVNTKVDSMTGAQVGIRVAVADSLTVGQIRLAHVAFVILADSQPPFDELPQTRRGILGIPVIIALQSMRRAGSHLDFGLPSSGPSNLTKANISFDGTFPVTEMSLKGRKLQFTLDTGAQRTDLYPSFATEFPEIMKLGQREQHELTGVGGSANFESLRLPSLDFELTGQTLGLHPAHVLLTQTNATSKWFAGNLGMDLLNLPRVMTLDFRSMRLSLR